VDLGLQGKVAFVAAASRGLGRAIAEELAAEGVSLVLCARGEEELVATSRLIRGSHGVPVTPLAGDLSRFEDLQRLGEAALRVHGRVDVLVTNAGGPPAGGFESHGKEAWDGAMRLTLQSAVELTRFVLPGMKERRWGRVVNVTSIAVKQPVNGLMLSNAFRAAVTGMAKTLANEVARYGITVNNVLPGYTRTRRTEELARESAAAGGTTAAAIIGGWEEEIPAGRLGEPKDLAALSVFLASERAGYITGQSIAADGGWIRSLL
jgi:3-oxoacyl-[acyl-carrier protein] reductase